MIRSLIFAFVILSGQCYGQVLPHFTVKGESLNGITADRVDKMKKCLQIFEQVMNDTAFQNALLGKTFAYDVPDDPFRDFTTAQAVGKIYAAREFYTSVDDNTANVYWEIDKKKKPIFSRHPALGYGYPTDTVIHTYTWFFDDDADLPDIVGHIAHEWSHKVGFQHAFNSHPGREDTVPYAFGDLVVEFAHRYL